MQEQEKLDLLEEVKSEVINFGKKKPIINEVKRSMNGPKGNEEWLRFWLEAQRPETILDMTKFMTGKRKKSTQNRLNKLSINNLVELALKEGYIRNV